MSERLSLPSVRVEEWHRTSDWSKIANAFRWAFRPSPYAEDRHGLNWHSTFLKTLEQVTLPEERVLIELFAKATATNLFFSQEREEFATRRQEFQRCLARMQAYQRTYARYSTLPSLRASLFSWAPESLNVGVINAARYYL